MELIASYMSDHSEDEAETRSRKRFKKSAITLDCKNESSKTTEMLKLSKLTDGCKTLRSSAKCVTLGDSDSENDIQSGHKNPFIRKTTLSAASKSKIDSLNLNSSDSECVTLGDSDSENDIQSGHKNPFIRKTTLSAASKSNIDYLNLNSSESDEENQSIRNDVSLLLESAADLNGVECGPAKPDRHCHQQRTYNGSSATRSDELMVVYSKLEKRDNKSTVFEDYKYSLKSLPEVVLDDSSDDEVVCIADSDIFREDARVSRAFEGPCFCYIPSKLSRTYSAHKNMVTALSWGMIKFSHLLLSASADCTLKIWDIFLKSEVPVQCIRNSSAFKAAKWSHDGRKIFAGGYGQKVHVYEASNGKEICSYDVNNYVSSIEADPFDENVFLCGSRNAIQSFDLRDNSISPGRTFLSNCEEVLDIAFLDADSFVCSTNVVSRDSADRTIMVWDLRSGAILSNQIFLERYTCPSIKVNYHDNSFAAQTNGDYIATFSMERPYKIQNKRYAGHKVSGFGIECDISPNGKYLVSGSANGDVYFYDYKSSGIVHKLITEQDVAINRVNWHPLFASTVATTSWEGQLQIWK